MPEGETSPVPTDLPIYGEILEFTRKKLKESRVVAGKTGDGETSYVAVGIDDFHFHVVPTDDPPVYEAQPANSNAKAGLVGQIKGETSRRAKTNSSTRLPVDAPFVCAGFYDYDYIGRNGSSIRGQDAADDFVVWYDARKSGTPSELIDRGSRLSGRMPDRVTYELKMTPAGAISGTSKDSCGAATINGTMDCETGVVELAKRYGWCNLWAQWKYKGQLEEIDGRTVILGRWESGRFAIWLDTKSVDQSEMVRSMMRELDARAATRV